MFPQKSVFALVPTSMNERAFRLEFLERSILTNSEAGFIFRWPSTLSRRTFLETKYCMFVHKELIQPYNKWIIGFSVCSFSKNDSYSWARNTTNEVWQRQIIIQQFLNVLIPPGFFNLSLEIFFALAQNSKKYSLKFSHCSIIQIRIYFIVNHRTEECLRTYWAVTSVIPSTFL